MNSQINIIDENIILNSDNIYYQIKEGFKGKLKLEVEKSDAVIEFLFKLNNVNQVKLEKNMTINMTKETTIIIVSNEIFSKILNFHLKSEKNLKFNIFFGYSKPPYSYYYPGNTNQFSLTINKMDIPIFLEKDIKLMDDEYYCILVENLRSNLLISFTETEDTPKEEEEEETEQEQKQEEEENSEDKRDENKGNEGLESWKISLIVVSSILILIILLLIVLYFFRKNKRLTDKAIEEKMENLANLKE